MKFMRPARIMIGWPILWAGHTITNVAHRILPDGVHRAAGQTVTKI